jgi:two-component system, OmpR family, sensor histidine kinase MprB
MPVKSKNLDGSLAVSGATAAWLELTVAGDEATVRDYGPGVPATDQPFIFDRFHRSEAARGQPGSGLGLAIVRQIAESHGAASRSRTPRAAERASGSRW